MRRLMIAGFMWVVAYLNVSVTDGCIHHLNVIIQAVSGNYGEKLGQNLVSGLF